MIILRQTIVREQHARLHLNTLKKLLTLKAKSKNNEFFGPGSFPRYNNKYP